MQVTVVSYELPGSTAPYEGFIHSWNTLDDSLVGGIPDNPGRGRLVVPAQTQVDGMEMDVSQDPPVLRPARLPPPSPIVSAAVFILRFTADEAVAFMKSVDPNVIHFMMAVQTGSDIDLTHPAVKNGIAYAVSIGLLTQDRATAILTP